MKCISARQTYPIMLRVQSVGDGLWGLCPDQPILSTKLEIEFRQYDDDEIGGTARFTHDCNANEFGLIYTDAVESSFFKFIEQHPQLGDLIESCSGSEQGMQAANILDMDFSCFSSVTFEALELMGFDVEEEIYE